MPCDMSVFFFLAMDPLSLFDRAEGRGLPIGCQQVGGRQPEFLWGFPLMAPKA